MRRYTCQRSRRNSRSCSRRCKCYVLLRKWKHRRIRSWKPDRHDSSCSRSFRQRSHHSYGNRDCSPRESRNRKMPPNMSRCGHQEKAAARLSQGTREAGRGGETDQPPLQLEASRRRPPASSPTPVIDESCPSPVIFTSGSALCSDGSFQPLAVESMARRTSTRPVVLEEDDDGRTAAA